ncbi:MAG: hypothetical protein GOU98_02890 [Candidatus Altiarchaeota archaeon]|nr:hypothetical protein [Candidatus Altiarchaeota archaeon]
MLNKKRLYISMILGAILGIFCIIGVGTRIGYIGNEIFLLATWYNRVLMGVLIGLAEPIKFIKSKYNVYLRGLTFGAFVSLAVVLTSGFRDIPSLFAGVLYGVIIDFVATKYSSK